MEQLKELRNKMNLTQQEMAEFLEISLSLYQKMEIGYKNISLETLKTIKEKENDIKKIVKDFDYNFFISKIIT